MSYEFPTWDKLFVGGKPIEVVVEIVCDEFDNTDGEKHLTIKGLDVFSGWVSSDEWLELNPAEKKLQLKQQILALQEQLNNIK